jgi:hypothetical protein
MSLMATCGAVRVGADIVLGAPTGGGGGALSNDSGRTFRSGWNERCDVADVAGRFIRQDDDGPFGRCLLHTEAA